MSRNRSCRRSRPRHVLDRVSLSVACGEFVSIVGFMGCGKSTLLNILSGVIRPDTGEIHIDGRPVAGVSERASIVFQNYSSAALVLGSGKRTPRRPCGETGVVACRAADAGGALSRARGPWQRHASATESAVGEDAATGGHRARVCNRSRNAVPRRAVRRARRADPRESPTGTGAPLLGRWRGVTTVMISNNLDEALLLSDRIIPMTRGPARHAGHPCDR